MRRPSGDAYAAILCLFMHYCGKVLFACSQSLALEHMSHWSSWPCAKHSLVFAGGKNNERNCYNFVWIFPCGLSSGLFISMFACNYRPKAAAGAGSALLYGHLPALLPWFVVSRTALLPLLADPRIKSSAHKCQMIDSSTAYVFSPHFSRDAYYADLLLLISISKALFAGSCTIKTAATQDMN